MDIVFLKQARKELQKTPGGIIEDVLSLLEELAAGKSLGMPISRPLPSYGLHVSHKKKSKNRCPYDRTSKNTTKGRIAMKKNLERYKSIDDLGSVLGVSKADLALMRAKKRAVLKLKKAREDQRLTQTDVAKLVGTKQPAIARMEAGLISEVSFDFLFKVAWALGVTLTLKTPSISSAA